MADRDVDILIIGGGLMGAALLLALADSGYHALLVESKPFSESMDVDFDARSLALSPASQRILELLKIWPLLQSHATAIHRIHVSEQYRFGCTQLHDEQQSALGYVVEMPELNRAMHQRIDPRQLLAPAQLIAFDPILRQATIQAGSDVFTVRARLTVAADGAHSPMRRFCGLTAQTKNYGQEAIVANIGLARPHGHVAYERFTPLGPLALLPLSGLRAALVWSLTPDNAARYRNMSEKDFLAVLQQTMGYRLGRFVKVGQRAVYPLQQVIMTKTVSNAVVFVGNAAHTLHPVAGQGFNLGLRDIATLAQCIAAEGLSDAMLSTYQQYRAHDQSAITWFTDSLVELFMSQLPGLGVGRSMGLLALEHLPWFKQILSRYARGFAGTTPDLACGIPLFQKEVS